MYQLVSVGRTIVGHVALGTGVKCIGKDSSSGLTDLKISRKQLKVRVGKNGLVHVKSVGKYADKLNGVEMVKGDEYVVKEGDVVALYGEGGFEFKLEAGKEPVAKKRRVEKEVGDGWSEEEEEEEEVDRLKNGKENQYIKSEKKDFKSETKTKSKEATNEDKKAVKESKKEKEVERSVGKEEVVVELERSVGKEEVVVELERSVGKEEVVVEWVDEGEVMMCTWIPPHSLLPSCRKMACFDLDGTIINTKSGRVFAKDKDDWMLFSGEVKSSLKKLSKDDYCIVFFTNQNAIGKGTLDKETFKTKVQNIAKEIGVPLRVFIATGKGFYRKPCHGMWKYLEGKMGDVEIDLKKSFYVGDAAGRQKGWQKGKKKDFSCSDRLFAINIGIFFSTPEEFFFKHKGVSFTLPSFDPRDCVTAGGDLFDQPAVSFDSEVPEVIVMVGSPASGKTHFVRKHLLPRGYVHVNRDSLGTQAKCLDLLQASLREGRSVVVDNTNPSLHDRLRWIEAAKGHELRCFVMNTPHEQCLHNEAYRQIQSKDHKGISSVVFNVFKQHLKTPSCSEGFKQVVKVNFQADFPSQQAKLLYRQFLVA